jgi:hypothetical protein
MWGRLIAPKGLQDSAQGFNAITANLMQGQWLYVPEGQFDCSLARSAWDNLTPRGRPVGYGLIRCRCATSIRRLKYWSDEVSDVKTEEIYVLRKRSITSNSSSNIIGHSVPGYDRCYPTERAFDQKDLRN